MHTLKLIDQAIIQKAARGTQIVYSTEKHGAIGELGSLVAEVLSGMNPSRVILKRFAAPDAISHRIGAQEFHRGRVGLSTAAIAQEAARALNSRRQYP